MNIRKLSFLLVLAILCTTWISCNGGHDYENEYENTMFDNWQSVADTPADAPTITAQTQSEEDKQREATYQLAQIYLEKYLKNGIIASGPAVFASGIGATELVYSTFAACGDYKDCKEILSRFSSRELLLSITKKTTSFAGNVENEIIVFDRDIKGTLKKGDPIQHFLGIADTAYSNIYYEYQYDSDDRISSVIMKHESMVNYAIVTPEYDADGKIVKAEIRTDYNAYTNTYIYDDQNRLTEARKHGMTSNGYFSNDVHFYTYQYDEMGRLKEELHTYEELLDKTKELTTYSYDEQGNLQKKELKKSNTRYIYPEEMICTVVEEFKYDVNSYLIESTKTTEYNDRMLTLVEQCRYTNDEQGRPVSAELTEVKNGVSTYASQQWTYFYHTFYFYNDK